MFTLISGNCFTQCVKEKLPLLPRQLCLEREEPRLDLEKPSAQTAQHPGGGKGQRAQWHFPSLVLPSHHRPLQARSDHILAKSGSSKALLEDYSAKIVQCTEPQSATSAWAALNSNLRSVPRFLSRGIRYWNVSSGPCSKISVEKERSQCCSYPKGLESHYFSIKVWVC